MSDYPHLFRICYSDYLKKIATKRYSLIQNDSKLIKTIPLAQPIQNDTV